jgi:polysaccharide pyruvyl transferase WcaK-like protein
MPASQETSARRIAIWGHFHGANLGDDLVVSSMIDQLRARHPEAEIVAISLNPADTRARHGIEAFPLTRQAVHTRRRTRSGQGRVRRTHARWTWGPAVALRDHPRLGPPGRSAFAKWKRLRRSLRAWRGRLTEPAFAWRSFRVLRDVDLLVVAGSGPIYDGWDGPWIHPYNLYKWTWLARLARTTVHMLSVGSGPIDSPLSRRFLGGALARAAYVSFRDESSLELVQRLKLLEDAPVVPDQAFACRLPRDRKPSQPRTGARVVGVNAMAHQDPRYLPHGARPRYQAYLEKIAAFVARLIEEGHEVRLLYSALADLRVCVDLQNLLRAKGALEDGTSLLRHEIIAEQQLLREIQGCDFVVAARYHCVLVPAAMGIPVLGLAYHPKTADLLARVGQSRFAFEIDESSADELTEAFRELLTRETEIHEELVLRSAECAALVTEQYDRLYGVPAPLDRDAPAGVEGSAPQTSPRAR